MHSLYKPIFWALPFTRERDYHIGSNFWKFYLIGTSFTFGELVSLVKVFRLERIVLMFKSVNTEGRCTTSYLLDHDLIILSLNHVSCHPQTISSSGPSKTTSSSGPSKTTSSSGPSRTTYPT